jgi:hypothetical protein
MPLTTASAYSCQYPPKHQPNNLKHEHIIPPRGGCSTTSSCRAKGRTPEVAPEVAPEVTPEVVELLRVMEGDRAIAPEAMTNDVCNDDTIHQNNSAKEPLL